MWSNLPCLCFRPASVVDSCGLVCGHRTGHDCAGGVCGCHLLCMSEETTLKVCHQDNSSPSRQSGGPGGKVSECVCVWVNAWVSVSLSLHTDVCVHVSGVSSVMFVCGPSIKPLASRPPTIIITCGCSSLPPAVFPLVWVCTALRTAMETWTSTRSVTTNLCRELQKASHPRQIRFITSEFLATAVVASVVASASVSPQSSRLPPLPATVPPTSSRPHSTAMRRVWEWSWRWVPVMVVMTLAWRARERASYHRHTTTRSTPTFTDPLEAALPALTTALSMEVTNMAVGSSILSIWSACPTSWTRISCALCPDATMCLQLQEQRWASVLAWCSVFVCVCVCVAISRSGGKHSTGMKYGGTLE